MLSLVPVFIALIVALWVFGRFVALEKNDRPEVVLAIVVVVLVLDSLLYDTQTGVPNGLFHPYLAGQSFRLPELMIVLGLSARLLVRGLPPRMTREGLAWTFFTGWYLTMTILGLWAGALDDLVFFQAKAVIYITGGIALAVGVPPSRLVNRSSLRTWFIVLGVITAVMVPLTLTGTRTSVGLPGLSIPKFGNIGPDGASVLVGIAAIALMVEGCRRRQRLAVGAAGVALLLAAFAPSQRAAVVGLVGTLVVLLVASASGTWRHRLEATPTQFMLCLISLVAVGLAFSLVRVQAGESLPLADVYTDTFTATRKQQSADTRLQLWDEGYRLWSERPVVGWGLGKEFEVRKASGEVEPATGGFHNIGYDLLVRGGAVSLVLFLVAVALTLQTGWRAWRTHPDGRIAALALACVAVAGGLLAKGMFESIFEKHRLATLLGLVLGVALSAAGSRRLDDLETEEPGHDEPAPTRRVLSWS